MNAGHSPCPRLRAAQLQREVLGDEVIGLEQHDDVHLELHFEVGGLQRGAGEQPGEDHVYGDREAPADVPVGDLNVLNLCGIAGVAFCTPAGLHADQLQLDAPDGGIRMLHHQLACQRLCDHAVGRVEAASNEEFGQQRSLKQVRSRRKGVRRLSNTLLQILKTENKPGTLIYEGERWDDCVFFQLGD